MTNNFPVDSRNPARTWLTLMDDTDRLDVMRTGRHSFLFVEVTDMDSACGRDNRDQPTFVAQVKLVDLDVLTPDQIRHAQESCGWDEADMSDPLVVAEMCQSYGHYAPLDEASGNGRTVVLREIRRAARMLAADRNMMSDAMERPVNKIGATAAEYMRGDIASAMQRGCEAGDPTARLMAKLHGVPEETINDVRPEDWLPYVVGYMDATGGHDRNDDSDRSPEYDRGYDRATRVKAGEALAPGWINRTA
jgi:hypothetical protein